MKKIFACIVSVIMIMTAQAMASQGRFVENTTCGDPFSADGWTKGYAFAYEIVQKPSGFKVKTLVNQGGRMIHLECERNLPSREAAAQWLIAKGYTVRSDGAEDGGASGAFLTVDRGPIYGVPKYLYSK